MSGPWEDFSAQPSGDDAGPWSEFSPAGAPPEKKQNKGILADIGSALVGGTKAAGQAIAATGNVYTGDEQGLVDKAKAQQEAQADKPEALRQFNQAVETRSKDLGSDPGLWDSIKAVGGAVLEQPKGAGLAIVEQIPNAVPAMAGGLAGMQAGAVAGTAVAPGVGTAAGGIVGGLAGMFLGNAAIETGHKAIESAQDGSVSPEEMAQIRKEGAVKAGVITGVDALTLGASKAITGAGARAVESATRKALTDAGVDITNEAAVLAARQSPEISSAVRAAQDAALASENTIGKRAAAGGAALGLETVGEGVGEYFGELAATGKANMVDAVLESVLSLGQSGAEVAWGAARNKKGENSGLWDVAGGKYAESKTNEIAGLLPAPTYTGTPGEQIVANDAERQAAIDAADKNAAELYAAREEFEQKLRQAVTIINEPEPLQQRIDEMLRIDASKLTGIERTNYEKQLAAAFAEPIGIRHDKDQREVPFTIGEYLDAQVALEDAVRNREKSGRAVAESDARLQQLADEELTQQPDISPQVRGIMPEIPVVGPLSKAANAAVQSGAHAATVMQQVQQQAAAGVPAATAGGSRPAPAAQQLADSPLTAAATQAAAPRAQTVTAPSQGAASNPPAIAGGITAPVSKPAVQVKPAEPKPAEKKGLFVGATPNAAEPITVRGGVVHIGDYPAQNFDTGEDVTVPAGATQKQVADALRKAGAISNKQRIFGLTDAADQPSAVKTETPAVATVTASDQEVEGVQYAKREDGSNKTKGEYTADEWADYTKSVIDKKLADQEPASEQNSDAKPAPKSPTEGGPEDSIGWSRMTTIEREGLLIRAGYGGKGKQRLNLGGAGALHRAWESMGKGIREKLIAAHAGQFEPASDSENNQSEKPLDMVQQEKESASVEVALDSPFANSEQKNNPAETDAEARFSKNTIFTADKVAAARARLKSKLGTMNSGIDPELLVDGMTIAGAYIESGVRKFGDYAKAMVADLGDGVKPYLLSFYEAARAYPGLNKMGMDSQESAAKQHQAMLTPEVKAAAKDVVGQSPKVEKKAPANLSESARLKADYGVRNIDGYTRSKTGKNQETDYGLKGGIKDEFLADAKRYLKSVATLLENIGFAPETDRRGKPAPAVSINEAGPAVSGDAYLRMKQGDFEVFAQIGVSSVRGIGPSHPQGVSLMVRAGKRDGMNNWLDPMTTAGELVAWFDKQRQAQQQRAAAVDIPVASAKLEAEEAPAAPAIGEGNGTATGQQGNSALAGVAAEQVRGTAGSESVADGSRSGGEGSGAGNAGVDGSRIQAGRSGGNRTSEVDSASARGNDRGRAGGKQRVGGQDGGAGPDQGQAGGSRSVHGELTPPAIPEANFEITEEVALGSGGQMTKYRDNVAAIKVLKTIEAERRRATAAEKKTLARYVGWGGIPNAFRNGVTGQVAKDWEKEVAELESLLTPRELRAAAASTRNAHYTAKEVVDFMWSAVRKMGFAGGMVLEPSVGTGNFIGLMPKELAGDSFVTGIELDSLTARIAGALYPKSTIVNTGFQKAALPSNRFKLAIGNPPFGAESLRFQYKPELNGASIHNQFFLGSMDALEQGGMMAMVVSRYLMDAKDATTREKLAIDAELLGAVRLPGSAFKGNALTEVVTDVLFFRKRDAAEAESLREAYFKRGKAIKSKDHKEIAEHNAAQQQLEAALRWTKTAEVKDPLGGEPMVVSQYFAERPAQIIGKMERSGSMRHGGDIDVKLEKGEKLVDRLNALVEKMSQLPIQTQNEEARANAEQFHRAMGESLRLSAKGAEADAIYFDDDGDLATVIERVGERGDETALTTIKVTPNTPWSPSLAMDLDGKWFREVVKTDKDGKPVKAVDAKGKETKRNVYVREVFKRESDIPKSLLLGETKYAKMKALISMRDLLVKQIDLEVSRAAPEQMEGNRSELRQAYEAFVRDYGYISDAKNAAIVSDMPDEGLLLSLETGYRPEVTEKKAKATGMAPSPASAKPAAILSRPVAIPPAAIDHAETPSDALAVVMSESGRIDIKRVAELRGLSEEAAADELTAGDTPLAFKDPESGNALVEKNAYLSGNVRRKLEAARQAGLEANIKALEAVQPEPWSSDKVTARMGSNWVPAETYGEFVAHLLGEKARVQYAKLTNTFSVAASGDSAAATSKWGTKRVPAPRLVENILNSTRIAVYDTDSEGNRHFNQTETDAANDKAKEIREEFDNWIFKDADRRAALTKLFNDIFNTRVTPQYDGSHLKFPGKVPDEIISLRRGQINAVWRGIIDDAVLYDHAVGAGKTFTGIARVMERRRMGMSKKPMIVVPNHMVGEWAAQAYRLYPGARILAATKKDLETKNRRRLFAKIASGDWDMVIVPHSSFQFISISPETEERILLEELATAQAALKEAEEEADPGARFKPLSVKEAEALIEKIEKRLETARGKMGKDRLLTFEQMGVDDLTIDESHEFKNLFYSSNLTDVRGMGNKQGSNKAFDLYSKTRVIREAGGSLAFLTGTPISNSAVELYNILRYLAPGTLQESGLEHFDAFRSQYVDATAKFEPTDSGGSLKLVTRLGRSWSNMRSLMELYYSVADVVTNDDIKRWFAEDNPGKEFPLPKVKGGDRQAVSVKPTPTQMRLLEETIAAFDGLDAIDDVKERNAERLRLMDRARKLSLHAKAVDPRLNDEAGGKLDVVADKAAAIYKKWMDDKGTQLIFLDRGVPKAKGDAKIIKEYDELTAKLREASLKGDEDAAQKIIDRLEKFDANEINELRLAQESNWNGYQHIKDRLVSLGVPANEIAFVQDFDGDAAKEQLFQAVRDGAIRILLGSSPRMGAGTNVQERLVALHHVDATWKPSDIEQREGRIIRQGNALLAKYGKDFEVEILAYVTERTVDAKLWDLNSTKLRMINAIRYYDGAFEMDFDDEAAVGMAEIAAIASGDPLLLERFKLATEIDNLYRQKRSHRRRVESAEDSLRSAKRLIENAPKEIQEAKEDAKLRDRFISALSEAVDSRRMVMDGKEYRHSDLTKARMDLENFAGAIGEDEKFSITINGNEFTSKGGAEEAIQIALGDAEPFVATIGGKTLTRRSDYARALRERIGERIDEGATVDAFDAGTIGGIPVSSEVVSKFGGPAIFVGVTGTYESTGRRRSIVGHRYLTPEKHKDGEQIPVTVNGLRPVIADFERAILSLRDNSDDIASRADRAKADISSLDEQVAEPFKGAADLEQKTARLAEVEAELSGRKTTSDAAVDEQNEGLGNIAEDFSTDEAEQFASDVLNELSFEDAAFRYPVSQSLTLEGNLKAALPGIEYMGEDTRPDELDESGADRRFVFAMPQRDQRIFYVYTKGNQVWIDVSRLLPGDQGSAVYHGVANYAYNTGKVFVGDPGGLSDEAIVRRTANMLSSAMRFGTTQHIEAAPEQIKGDKAKGIAPLKWSGSDLDKTKALIHTFVANLRNSHPTIDNYEYDFDKLQFRSKANDQRGLHESRGRDGNGQAVGGMDGRGTGGQLGTARAGSATLRRGIFLTSLLAAESSQRPGILEQVLRRSSQFVTPEGGLDGVFSRRAKRDNVSPADKAVYGMAAEGKSAADILKFIASASRSPFNRQLAKLLLKTGIAPKITIGDQKGWKFNAGNDKKYAAAYNPKADTVALFRPGAAERHMLHELMHAATLKALARNGLAAGQMRALFNHVKKTGALHGMYGMSNVDEFVAEAFTNPKFQQALKKVKAPQGGTLQSAWHWFVRVVRGILGLKQGDESALSAALELGLGVMRENMGLQSNVSDIKYSYGLPAKQPINLPIDGARLKTLRGLAAGIERPKDGIFLRVTDNGDAIATGQKGQRIPDSFRRFAEDNGLTFRAERRLPNYTGGRQASTMDVGITPKSEPMPIAYRESGAMYFGEATDGALDRTNKTRFNVGTADKSKVRQIDTPEFKNWFGDSKVVDGNGSPLVVYHGAPTVGFSQFWTSNVGAFFSDRFDIAASYAGRYNEVEFDADGPYADDDQGVYATYLSIKNPMVVDWGGKVFSQGPEGLRTDDFAARAKRNGFDGLVIENVADVGEVSPGLVEDNGIGTVYVAFSPTQIKSAIGNNGDFDPNNPDIRYNVADDGAWSVSEPSKMDDVIYALQDKHVDTKRVVQAIAAAGKKIRDAFNPYLQEELFHGRAAKGVKDFLDLELRPLLKEMQTLGVDMGDFEEYLWNRHAEERNRQIAKVNPDMPDGGSGIKTAEARAYLAGLPAETRAKYERLAKRIDAINRGSQQVLVDSGLETQETIDAWNGAYQHYVPLQREDVDSGHVGTGKGFSIRGSATKRAMGSGRKVVDIIGNLTMQRERNIVRAEKNRVSNALLGLAVQNPNPEFWTVDQAPKERVVQERVIYTVKDAEGNATEFTSMGEAEKFARSLPDAEIEQAWGDRVTERVVPGFSTRDNVILTRINGQDHYVVFNERDERAMRMARSMKNLDADELGRVLSIVGKATRYLASMNTQYNPVFGVINLIRDAQGALLNLSSTPLAGEQKRVLGYTVDALRGIYADIRAHRAGRAPSSNWAKLFEEFQKQGGQTGYRDQYANAEDRAESIRSELAQFKEGKAKQLVRGVFGWLSDYNETMENAVRLAAYKTAIEKGMSKQQAASLAKNITVNFNRKGQMATQVGALYAFFNASVQGTARIAETLFEKNDGDLKSAKLSKVGKKIIAGGIMLGSMQALLLAAAGFDDDEPPEFIRERNLILPIGDGKYLTLAMPLGFHVLPGIGRIATEFVLSGGKDPAKRAAGFFGMFVEAFNPVGSAGFSLQTITPSVVDPFAALAENKDFTGREIYREDFNSLNPQPGHARAKDVATLYSRWISEALNFITGGSEFKPGVLSWSPDALDYLVAQAGGGVMREANKVFQTAGATYSGEDLPLYKIPLVGRFVGDTEGQSGQSAKFYEAIKQINMHEAEYKGLMKSGRVAEAREYMQENPAVRLMMAGNHVENQVRKLRSMKRDLVEKDAPKDQVRAIDDRISETMRKFNERASSVL